MAESEAPMAAAAEAKAEEVEKEEGKGPRHYQIEHPYVCVGEPKVEYAPTPSPSSSSSAMVVVEITWKRVLQYVTTINGTSTLDRRGPVETLGSSSSSFPAASLVFASSPYNDETTITAGEAWLDVVASFPAAAHLAPFFPGSLLAALSFDLYSAIAKRPGAATVLYKQELTILHTHIHNDRLAAVRDLLDEIGTPARLVGASCGACYALHRRELDFVELPCSHAFHGNCIFVAFWSDTRCPTCHRRFRRNEA